MSADNLETGKAAGIGKTVGGLVRQYLEPVNRQFGQAKAIPEEWATPNGCLLIPARQIFLPAAIFPADIWSPRQPG